MGGYKDIFAIVLSRAAGQALLLLSTLYVASFIGPRAFGYVGLFTSTVAIACQLTSGRAEAVALAARTSRGKKHFIAIAYALNLAAFGGLVFAAGISQFFVENNILSIAIMLFPVAVLMQSLNQYVLPAQITMDGRKSLAGRQVGIAAAMTSALQVVAAHFAPTAAALIGARTSGQCLGAASAAAFVTSGVSRAMTILRAGSWWRARPIAREFLLSSPSAILTILAFQLPVYLFGFFGLVDEIGLFWLGFNLLFTPYLVISASVRPLFLHTISRVLYEAELKPLLRKSCLYGGMAGAALALAISLASWFLIARFLPPEWLGARSFVVALAIIVIGLAVALPFNAAVPALRSQRPNFVMNLIQFIARALALFVPLWLGAAPATALFAMAFTSLLVSLVYVGYMFNYIESSQRLRTGS
jgi:O-antigen/teichoic acid export membrane protein